MSKPNPVTALRVSADGRLDEIVIAEPEVRETWKLLLDVPTVERLKITDSLMLYGDDAGRMRGAAPNPLASWLAGQDIVGDVIFVGRTKSGKHHRDVPPLVVEMARKGGV